MRLYKKAHGMQHHLLIGGIVLAVLYFINTTYKFIEIPTDNFTIITLVTVGLIYSLMPDIDQPGSIINKYVAVGLVGLIIYAFWSGKYTKYGIIAAVVLGLLKLIHHRTLIHSVLGAVIISAPLLYLGVLHFVVGLVAFLTHIIADGDFSIGWENDWW